MLQPTGTRDYVSLKSHLGKYLAVDGFGNVTCEADELEAGGVFEIAVADDGSGRWGTGTGTGTGTNPMGKLQNKAEFKRKQSKDDRPNGLSNVQYFM